MIKKSKNKNILIIGHGDPLWLLEGAVRRLSPYIKVGELRKLN
ncbi:MAG: hypothetical protein AAB451_00345 [Patescibacteria group bacterium]